MSVFISTEGEVTWDEGREVFSMKIYTGTGDGGKTSLFSGERIKKNSLRVDTYGDVDELCSHIGVIASLLPQGKDVGMIQNDLQLIQADLFSVGALLAMSMDSPDQGMLQVFSDKRTSWLEQRIDSAQDQLEELRSFILPGGHISAAHSQVVRTICRRVERKILQLAEQEGCYCTSEILAYMNRLSDYFFVLARLLNTITGSDEIIWHG